MHNYNNGDLIYMIGFSRGALLCRILAGFLERVGILENGNKHLLNDAWTLYQGWEYLELKSSEPQVHTTLLNDFRNTFSKPFDVVVEFLGLFDTVNSSGILNDRIFPFTARSGIVNHIRHALSIDERREKYKPHIFLPNPANYSKCHDMQNEVNGECNFNRMFDYKTYLIEKHVKTINFKKNLQKPASKRNNFLDYTLYINTKLSPILDRTKIFAEYKAEPIVSIQRVFVEGLFKIQLTRTESCLQNDSIADRSPVLSENLSSDLIEKWFSGDHADVGGGWHMDNDVLNEFQMSNIPLRWMIVECMKHGIEFKKKHLKKYIQAVPVKKCLLAHQHDCLSLENTTWGRHSYYFTKDTKPFANTKMIWRMKYLENYRPSNINESFKWILQNEASINFNGKNVDNVAKSHNKRVLPVYLGTTTIKDYSKPRKSPLTSPYVSYPYRKFERQAELTHTNVEFPGIMPIPNDRSNSTNTITSTNFNTKCVFMDDGGNYLTQVNLPNNYCNLTRYSFDSYVIEELKRVELELAENIKTWEKDGYLNVPDELYNYMIENHML
ncbi:hypothetical protein ACO0OL_002403 [Hanseniaspora opuntiae]